MDECDVLICGGGPAGSSCAWALARLGFHVVVLDAKIFPRDKVCAGWITPAVLTELEIKPAEYAPGRVLQSICGFRTGWMDGRRVETLYGRTVSYGIRRCEFDEFLLRRSGAQARLGTPLESLERAGDRWVVNGAISAPMLVGAGGHFCPVARHMGAKPGCETAITAQEVEFAMSQIQAAQCPVQEEIPEVFFCRDRLGYGWVVRKGDFLNVGLGRLQRHGLAGEAVEFMRGLQTLGVIPSDCPGLRGHAYLLRSTSARSVVGDGVMLAGDAAGLAWTESGEGIRPAVESGLLAARVIAATRGHYGRERLLPYARLLEERFGRAAARQWTDHLPRAVVEAVAGSVMESAWFAKHVVLNRWFLHAAVRPLSPA